MSQTQFTISIPKLLKSKSILIPTSITLTLLIFTFLLNYTDPFTPLTSLPSIITRARNGSVLIGNGSGSINGSAQHDGKQSKSSSSCDIFDGKWVHDESYPIYPPGSCPFIDKFSCFVHGRSDLGYLSYRWQPLGCDIPRFDGKKMLEMLRGKRLVFWGDSLNRNMCLSLICALSIHTGIIKIQTKNMYAFRLKDYNCSITNIKAPFLVEKDTQRGTLRLDQIQHKASEFQDADFLIFNTGRWWNPNKAKRGENFFQEGDFVHSKMELGEAYGKALSTWAKWVDKSVNKNKTLVFFAGITAAHFSGGQWNSGGNCHGETEPITNSTLLARYPRMMRTLESVISNMSSPVIYLNITRMTGYRKDAHPSIYWQSKTNRRPGTHQDCTHWCLPGVPDTWNELLFELKYFDPFLILDEFSVSAPAGFPDHPHRGFETLTYMLQGAVTHEDFAGHKGTIGAGDLQWMTARRGIVHSEMPAPHGVQKGLQPWINLSSKHKVIEPRYQEIQSKDVAEAENNGVKVRVIAGESLGTKSPIYTRTQTLYLDFTLKPGAHLEQPIPISWNAFVHVLEGAGNFGSSKSTPTTSHHLLLLGLGDGLMAWNNSTKPLRFNLIGGEPLGEPLVQFGPFVMNTQDEIDQTIEDFENCVNGFERAKCWQSNALVE